MQFAFERHFIHIIIQIEPITHTQYSLVFWRVLFPCTETFFSFTLNSTIIITEHERIWRHLVYYAYINIVYIFDI